jgi:hypothetical protein
MLSYVIYFLLMGLILVVLILKPELGIQFKEFTEKFAFDAEWKPSKSTRWRFVVAGIFIEALFLFVLIVLMLEKK